MEQNDIRKNLLAKIADLHEMPQGAYNIRENSKLSVGDTFHAGQIIEGEPLYLQCLVHEGGQPVNYVCGKVGGVKYRLL